MRPIKSTDPWQPGHVVVGQSISTNKASNPKIYRELHLAGCNGQMAVTLIASAMFVGIALNKAMEKSI